MNMQALTDKLRALPDKRAFCRQHGLKERTLWRMLSHGANPLASTVAAFAAAIKRKMDKP